MESLVLNPTLTEELYKKYYAELIRFGSRLSSSESQAEDMVQNAFLKLKTSADNGDRIESVRSWLYRVIYNDFLTQNKRNNKLRDIHSEAKRNLNRSYDPNTEYDTNERKRIVREELKNLKYEDRTILLLYGEDLSYKEIAEIMQIGRNYVGSYISRARKRLIKQLKEKYNELFD